MKNLKIISSCVIALSAGYIFFRRKKNNVLEKIYEQLDKFEYDKAWVFQTKRTIIRPLLLTDVIDLYDIICEKESIEMSGDYFTDMNYVKESCSQDITNKPSIENTVEFGIIDKETGKFIGHIQIYKLCSKMNDYIKAAQQSNITIEDYMYHDGVAVGYSIHKKLWGHGLMTEVMAAVIEYCFSVLNIPVIFGDCLATNIGSIRVMEKNNFQKLGEINKENVTYKYYVKLRG